MSRARGLCRILSQRHGKPSGATEVSRSRRGAACICCIGPHHKPSGGGSGGPCLPPKLDLSVKTPLVGCCSSGDRGRSSARTPRTPKTPCTPSARRLCGVRSRTPRPGQVCCFPVQGASAVSTAAASARTPRTPKTPLGRPQRACCVRGPAQGNKKLWGQQRWFLSARQALAQSPRRMACAAAPRDSARDVKIHSQRHTEAEAAAAAMKEETCSNDEYALLCREGFSREDVAAVTIQAYFRGHLARRAFKALKSLVRLQAVARGAYVRRQAEVAVHCMQALVRLQGRVRARQMLTKSKEAPLLKS